MKLSKCLFPLFLATLAVSGYRAYAQANITENQSTYIYVDANAGSDSNSGAQNSPLKTIQAAIDKANTFNQKSIGTKVEVLPGIYREFVNIAGYNLTGAALTVQATANGTAIIAGSDVLTGWSKDVTGAIYSRGWTYAFGECAVPSGWPSDFAEIARRREMIFVNNSPLTQVLSYGDLRPGTFYVNETYSVIHIEPPTGTDMATATVEAAVRPQTLSVINRTNVVLRGLVFRHATNCFNTSGATVTRSSNILVDSVQALWNNWGGLNINASSNITVQNSIASYNGGVGFQATKDQNTLYSFNESDYNNWRGAQAAFYDWAMGGMKMFAMHSTTVKNHFSYNNQAQGLWFDTDNKNITIDNATLSGNVQAALQIERNEGPISLMNSHLCSSGVGVNVLTSPNVTIQNNSFYNNSGTNKYQAEIYIAGQAGGKIITDWQTGQNYDLFTTGMVLSGNTFQNTTSAQLVFGTYLSGTDWTSFATTLRASNNNWYNPTTKNAFKVLNGKLVALTGWQSSVGTDYDSVWQAAAVSPVVACKAPSTTFTDFSVIVDSRSYAMVAGKAVATVRINSFGSGTVALQPKGMPSGVTASLSQQSLVSGAITLTLSSSKTAVTQKVPITLNAFSGSRVHSVTFYVQVYPL